MPPRTRRSNKLALPRDYTFAPSGIPIHKASFERVEKLLQQTRNRDPDAHGMYIYNDYFGYAVLDLVDKTLSAVHTHIIKKRWLDAWHALDALAKYNEICGEWINVDDGDHVRATEAAHGALIVTTIRALDAAGQFNEQSILDLGYTLRDMTQWTDTWWDTLDTCYHKVLKAYGKKLYGDRTDEEWERIKVARKDAYNTFVRGLSKEEREKMGYELIEDRSDDDDDEESESDDAEGERKAWYEDGDVEDIDLKDPSFSVSRTWKEYKDYLRDNCSGVPFYGPPEWDLTKWSDNDKKPFKHTTREGRFYAEI